MTDDTRNPGTDHDRDPPAGVHEAERAAPRDGDPATPAGHEHEGPSPEDVENLVSLLRRGDAELPVGAEDFAAALIAVAAERDELRDRLTRTAADFQNFRRRAQKSEQDARDLARVGVVQSLLQVLDFFDLALQQNPDTATAQQVLGGVQMIKGEFIRVLEAQGVSPVTPAAGDDFDPTVHEAIEQAPADNIEPGRVARTRSPGYRIGDRVIRPAKVTVAAASAPADAPRTNPPADAHDPPPEQPDSPHEGA